MTPEQGRDSDSHVPIDDPNVIDYSVLALAEFIEDPSTPLPERIRLQHAIGSVEGLSIEHVLYPEVPLELKISDAQTCVDALRRYRSEDRLPEVLRAGDRPDRIRSTTELLASRIAS